MLSPEDILGFKKVVSALWDENQEAFNALYFIRHNYKKWEFIFKWFKDNKLRGQDLADFFKNESDESGGGYHLGVTFILSKLKGHRYESVSVKGDELL